MEIADPAVQRQGGVYGIHEVPRMEQQESGNRVCIHVWKMFPLIMLLHPGFHPPEVSTPGDFIHSR